MKTFLLIASMTFAFGAGVMAQASAPAPSPLPFLMEVEDVFSISGMGTVAAGKIERGTIRPGDAVEIVGRGPSVQATVVRVDASGKATAEAAAGTTVGLLLRGVEKADVARGRLITRPGSVKAVKKFRAAIDLNPPGDGGRKTPIVSGFRPQIFFRGTGFSGVLTLLNGKENAAAGEKAVVVDIELTETAGLEIGTRFFIREYGRTIATGAVTSIE
ncbi:MAG: EF-Tu/IF-2/RF-3 family GTPase [Pyrinomonadaceae bacterium]